jgi:riboflavin transporter FmnP
VLILSFVYEFVFLLVMERVSSSLAWAETLIMLNIAAEIITLVRDLLNFILILPLWN